MCRKVLLLMLFPSLSTLGPVVSFVQPLVTGRVHSKLTVFAVCNLLIMVESNSEENQDAHCETKMKMSVMYTVKY